MMMVRRLLLILLLSCGSLHAQLAVTLVCSTASFTTSSNTVACTSAVTTTAGAVIGVFVKKNTSTATLSSVSDGTNTYSITPQSPISESTTVRRVWNAHADNAASLTNATYTATFASSDTASRDIVVFQVTGVSTSTPFDKETGTFADVSSVADPGSTALSFNNEAIVEYAGVATSATAGSTFTELIHLSNSNEVQYKIVSTGSWGVSAFASSNASWISEAMTFTDGGGSGPVPCVFKGMAGFKGKMGCK